MARQFMPSVHNPQVQYNMQSANYPHFVQQQGAYYPNMQLYYPSQQQQQQQQPGAQQQQQQHQSSVSFPNLQSNNMNKAMERPKSKRSSTKIVIKDPTKDNKDITDEILANANQSASSNGKVVGTPPSSSNSGMQTDSSIQATFAAKVAAAVGEGKKGNEKAESDKNKIESITKPQPSQDHVEQSGKDNECLSEAEKNNENEQSATDDVSSSHISSERKEDQSNSCAVNSDTNSTDLPELNADENKGEALADKKRTEIVKNDDEQQSPLTEKVNLPIEISTDSQEDNIVLAPKVKLLEVAESKMMNGLSELNNEDVKKDLSKREMKDTESNITEDAHEEPLNSDTVIQDMNYNESKAENVDNSQKDVCITDNTEPPHTGISEEPTTNKCSDADNDNLVDNVVVNNASKENTVEEKQSRVEEDVVSEPTGQHNSTAQPAQPKPAGLQFILITIVMNALKHNTNTDFYLCRFLGNHDL